MIKKDVVTIRNKATKQVKGIHPIRSLIWLSGYRGWKVFFEQIATHMRLSSQVYLDVDPRPGGEPQRPGPKLGPHHNGALPKRSVDLGRRNDDGEVSLLKSNEGIPELPQVGQDLSQVCFNPVPHVITKWFSP